MKRAILKTTKPFYSTKSRGIMPDGLIKTGMVMKLFERLPEKELEIKGVNEGYLYVKAPYFGRLMSEEHSKNFRVFTEKYKKKGWQFSVGYGGILGFRKIG